VVSLPTTATPRCGMWTPPCPACPTRSGPAGWSCPAGPPAAPASRYPKTQRLADSACHVSIHIYTLVSSIQRHHTTWRAFSGRLYLISPESRLGTVLGIPSIGPVGGSLRTRTRTQIGTRLFFRVTAHTDTRRRRSRFNVGRVLVLNRIPARRSPCMLRCAGRSTTARRRRRPPPPTPPPSSESSAPKCRRTSVPMTRVVRAVRLIPRQCDWQHLRVYAALVGGADGVGAWRGMVTIVELIDPRPYILQAPVYGRLIYTVSI